jgi:ABC-type transporter MlaC component
MDAAFDMDAISRRIIGRWWDGLDDAMRAALAQRLRRYAVAVLASRFDAHDGECFETGELREVTADTVTVCSLFHRPADPPVQLDYALLRGAAGWRIVDVWFDGVSGTRIQHDEFAAFLRRGGAEQLLRRLDEVSARLESGSGLVRSAGRNRGRREIGEIGTGNRGQFTYFHDLTTETVRSDRK